MAIIAFSSLPRHSSYETLKLVQRHRITRSRTDGLGNADLVVLPRRPYVRVEVEVDAVQRDLLPGALVEAPFERVHVVLDARHLQRRALTALAQDVVHDAVAPALLPLGCAADADCRCCELAFLSARFSCLVENLPT